MDPVILTRVDTGRASRPQVYHGPAAPDGWPYGTTRVVDSPLAESLEGDFPEEFKRVSLTQAPGSPQEAPEVPTGTDSPEEPAEEQVAPVEPAEEQVAPVEPAEEQPTDPVAILSDLPGVGEVTAAALVAAGFTTTEAVLDPQNRDAVLAIIPERYHARIFA